MISPEEASLETLLREGVLLVRYPCLDSQQADAMLTELVQRWGRGHDHRLAGQLVWDVRQQNGGAARSQGLDEFILHTDASFEDPPPRFVGLFVVREDRLGGGRSEWISSADVLSRVSPRSRKRLSADYRVRVPAEFCKGRPEISAPLVCGDMVRYRRELIQEPEDAEGRAALEELENALQGPRESQALEPGTLLLLDNWRVFHGRTTVHDPARHLKRVRFFGPDVPPSFGVCRLAPEQELPERPYVPGTGAPRPNLDGVNAWHYGIDLFNWGYYWEAHEAWEELWQNADKRSAEGLALRGLIQVAAACLKARQGNQRGVDILRRRAQETLESSGLDEWRGLSLQKVLSQLERLPAPIYLR